MTAKFRSVFGTKKPIIAMVHFGALPGSPLYDAKAGIDSIVAGIRKDLAALQDAGVDAVMFGNENDRPYEFKVDAASTATMAYAIGVVKHEIKVPFGVNVLWDPMSSMALATATGAKFVREIMTGTYASDMGPWNPDAGAALRYRDRLGSKDVAVLLTSAPSLHIRWINAAWLTAPEVPCSPVFLMPFLCQVKSPVRPPR